MSEAEVLFEFVRIGPQIRIAAIHSGTGTEVVVIAPASASQAHMQQLALAKLRKKLGQTPQPLQPQRRF